MAGRIWFDVSTMMRWQLPPVGIVRVERECARDALCRDPAEISFCLSENGRFTQVARDEVERKLKATAPLLDATATSYASKNTHSKTFSQLARAFRRRIMPMWEDKTHIRPDASIQTQDVYLSMGLDWDDKDQASIDDLRNRQGVRVVRMCHDLIPVNFPELSHPSAREAVSNGYFSALALGADTIVCISATTRYDLSNFLQTQQIVEPPLSLIRLGHDIPRYGSAQRPETVRHCDFILYVSTIEVRKNHEILVRAYQRLVDAGFGDDLPTLVFVGMKGWGVDALLEELSTDRRLREKIVILNGVSDAELHLLYEQCKFTVFPSRYEGWGLGVSESLAHAKFCIASNAGALMEAGGDLVEYLDPNDEKAWAQRLLHYVMDTADLARRTDRIRADFVPVTWQQTADRIFAICRQLHTD